MFRFFYIFIVITFLSACGGSSEDKATLSHLELTVSNTTLDYQQTSQITASAIDSDNRSEALPTGATFSSSNTNVVTVSETGLITAISEGQSTVSASYKGKESSQTITVSYSIVDSSIQLTPDSDTLIEDTNYQLEFWVEKSDSLLYQVTSGVTWSVDNTTFAQISQTGLLSLISSGDIIIEGNYEGFSSQRSISIQEKAISEITIDLPMSQVPLGHQTTATINALYNNGSSEDITSTVALLSSDESVAVVNDDSVISSLSVGTTTLSAEFEGISANKNFIVTDAIAESLLLNLSNNSVPAGMVVNYSVQERLSDGTLVDITDSKSFTLALDSSDIATIENYVISAVSPGSVSISATSGELNASALLSVSEAVVTDISLSTNNTTIPLGLSDEITTTATLSTGSEITIDAIYTSSDEDIITVNQEGIITTKGIGQAIITGQYNDLESTISVDVTAAALSAITVSFETASIPIGRKTQASAIGYYTDNSNSDITNDVTWSSALPNLVAVSNAVKGELSALVDSSIDVSEPVPVLITASSNGLSNSAEINAVSAVVEALTVSAPASNIALGKTLQLTATATYSDLSNINVSSSVAWSSSDESVATMSSNGLLATIAEGSATISAEFDTYSETFLVTVGPADIESLAIQPEQSSIYKGRLTQFNAIATMSDGSTETLNSEGTWSVDQESIASISNVSGSHGELTGIDSGNVTVTFTPDDSSLLPVTEAINIKAISQMASQFSQSASSSISVINNVVQNGSQLSLTITNNTGETLNLLMFSAYDANGLKTSTSDSALLSGGSLTSGESVGLTYTVNFLGATRPITLTYGLEDPITGDTFSVSRSF